MPGICGCSWPRCLRASEVIITRGPWPPHAPDALEVMFEDGSDAPYAYHIAPPMLDRVPPTSEAGRALTCTVWTSGPTCQLTLPARLRVAETLPHMRPWSA
jgi:hypothetical protein